MGVITQIRKEMKIICSLNHNSILRADHEAIKDFDWNVVYEELVEKFPHLLQLYKWYCQNQIKYSSVG